MGVINLGKNSAISASEAISLNIESFGNKRKSKHELWIVTCYFTFPAIKRFVEQAKRKVRVSELYLAFNFAEIYREGPAETKRQLDELNNWLKEQGIDFEWIPLLSGALVHSKGYAVIQRSKGKIVCATTLITSANLTDAGFFGRNVEIGYISNLIKDAKEFESIYNELWCELGASIDATMLKEQEYLFKYALLASGVFLHKWSGSLSQLTGIKYTLTEEAKKKITLDPELIENGLLTGDTFTRQQLPLKNLPPKEIPAGFIRKYTVETYWGRWCPTGIWDEVTKHLNQSGADQFIEEFTKLTEDKNLKSAAVQAIKAQKVLITKNLIKPPSNKHIENWVEKINDLRKNKAKLQKLFTGYEANNLPYEFENYKDVEELFSSLIETIHLSGNENSTMSKILEAQRQRDVSKLQPTQDDVDYLCKIGNEE